MSRQRPRAAAIAERLSEVLQDDLADIASTIGWIDATPPSPDEAAAQPLIEEEAPPDPGQAPDGDPSFDLLLDDFASAVDAMFSARDETLALHAGGDEAAGAADHGGDGGRPRDDGTG